MGTTPQLIKQLRLLQALVEQDGMGDEVTEMTISKLLHYEVEKLRGRQRQMEEKLSAFEAQYHLNTEEFCRRFREGQLGDAMDFLEWSALADMHLETSQRLAEAEQISHAAPHTGTSQ
jgi:hypothetical protein